MENDLRQQPSETSGDKRDRDCGLRFGTCNDGRHAQCRTVRSFRKKKHLLIGTFWRVRSGTSNVNPDYQWFTALIKNWVIVGADGGELRTPARLVGTAGTQV